MSFSKFKSAYRPLGVPKTFRTSLRPTFRCFTTPITQDPVLLQLQRVANLQERVSGENSKSAKQAIIAEYPDLRDLLELIYDPQHRTRLSYAVFQKHLTTRKGRVSLEPPPSIAELVTWLGDRTVVGDEAKNVVMKFLADHDILSSEYETREDRQVELEVFGRLLDRNLVAGFGAKTLSTIKWKGPDNQAMVRSQDNTPAFGSDPSSASSIKYPKIQDPFKKQKETSSTRRNLKTFPVALGKSIEPPFTELSKSTCKWFASRKLDGVRVISYLDFMIPSDGSSPTLERCEFYSRTGKIFTSLGKVQEQLRRLGGYPRLRGLLDAENNFGLETSGGQVKRLMFDGEVCVMRERKGQEQESIHRPDDGTGAGAIWSDHNLEEDFASTVSEIRRMEPYTIHHPVYFIFDILPYSLFEAAKGSSTFGQRVEEIRNLGEWLSQYKPHEKILRPLAQWEIEDFSEIDGMVARAAEEGWEGLVMRADKPYKGSRSTDIRKFKKWQDAEYTVVGVENSRMRLSVDGVYGEHDAMANIWIKHKGVDVSVGSGFTADQRIRYGRNPELIIGKEVTVEYFSESASSSREGMSLRFPRVKQIWYEGERTM